MKAISIMKPAMENRRHFVENMLLLGLHHAWREARSGKDFAATIGLRSPVYRLTVLWDGRVTPATPGFDPGKSDWGRIVRELEKAFRRYQDDGDGFEATGFARLWPLAEPRIEKDIEAWPWVPEGYSPARIPDEQVFGCFACEWAEDDNTALFHICNACLPESPFKDMEARRKELLGMLNRIADEWPRAEFIKCNSWLNSLPPFQALFPPDYPRRDRVAPLGMGFNWWGQFMRRDGGFHEKHGGEFRQNGRFPFAAIDGYCKMPELKRHLLS